MPWPTAYSKNAMYHALILHAPNTHRLELSNEVYYLFLAQAVLELQAVKFKPTNFLSKTSLFILSNVTACNSATTRAKKRNIPHLKALKCGYLE